ncbi:MAG: hypothetical protein H7222_01510 [Methylotenera sp.]|nr:hypothetical protein [Oligoflexia bacterium]
MTFSRQIMIVAGTWGILSLMGCSTLKSVFVTDTSPDRAGPIQNPFGGYDSNDNKHENIVLRSKRGDRSVEVEIPNGNREMSDLVMPVSPNFKGESAFSGNAYGESAPENYKDRKPGISDREITGSFPKNLPEFEGKRQEIESGLGVMTSDDNTPASDQSYLAALDHIKQLYKSARYEAGLLELDELTRLYPTDPKIYQMRGTLLDRLGRTDLALKSWNQSLRFDPGNTSLRKFIEKKQQKRGLASGRHP